MHPITGLLPGAKAIHASGQEIVTAGLSMADGRGYGSYESLLLEVPASRGSPHPAACSV